jgi:hypothetical protein
LPTALLTFFLSFIRAPFLSVDVAHVFLKESPSSQNSWSVWINFLGHEAGKFSCGQVVYFNDSLGGPSHLGT